MASNVVSSSKTSQTRGVFGKTKVHIQDKDDNSYIVGKFLGKGGFARCYESLSQKTGLVYACKIVDKSLLTKSQHKEKMTSEITIHRSLNHPNVLKFISYFEDVNNVYVMLELCPNRSFLELHKRRRFLTDPESKFYFKQLVAGVAYLHNNNIIHRDLKLGNLLLDANLHVKIADFGLATVLSFDGEKKKTLCGTPNYIAPEILAKCGHSFEVDVWSAGCILYTFYVGVPPFETNRLEETYDRIKKNVYSIPTRVPNLARELIIMMLHRTAKKRPSMAQVLENSYFTTGYMPKSLPHSSLSVAPRFDDLAGNHHQSQQPQTAAATHHQSATATASTNRMAAAQKIKEAEPVTIAGFRDNGMIQMKWFPPEPHGVINPDDSNNPSDTRIVQVRDNEVVTVDLHNAGPDAAALEMKEPADCYLNEALKIMKSLILANPHHMANIVMDESEDPASTPVYWITKWVDYSDKYGLGYALSDNSVGVLFNDTTHMQKIPCEERLGIYIAQDGQEIQFSYDKNANPALAKKIHIFENYIKYMDANLVTTGLEIILNRDANITRLPYLRLWIRNDDVIVFHLTCGILQANFFKDHTKIFLCPKMNAVTYIDENRVFKTYQIDKLKEFGCIEPIVERISYVRMVVKKVLKTIHQTASSN